MPQNGCLFSIQDGGLCPLPDRRVSHKRKPKLWTKTGLVELGQLIRDCRKLQKLTLQKAVMLIEERTGVTIALRTLSSIETAVGMPEFNTLSTIAAAGFVEKNGVVLSIYDFIDIASETYVDNMDIIAELLKNYLEKNNLTIKQFADICELNEEDLQAIACKQKTADYESDLIVLSKWLDNPETGEKFNNHSEMIAWCQAKCAQKRHLLHNGH